MKGLNTPMHEFMKDLRRPFFVTLSKFLYHLLPSELYYYYMLNVTQRKQAKIVTSFKTMRDQF